MSNPSQNIHFIAIGGSIMHNLAIALQKKGHKVTGSDDEIFDPSRSLLEKNGLLPKQVGWDENRIHDGLDAVILGMHAREDNIELKKAQDLGLKIYSFPDYIYEQSIDKQRIVIAGSHGKTTITSIIMHVLQYFERSFDYAVGARIDGFEEMVQISDAPIIIIEGDEYLSSPIDRTPKFLKYHHHIGLISGVWWDHINVFPTEEDYVKQFDLFADATPKAGSLIYCDDDSLGSVIGAKGREDVNEIPYKTHPHSIEDGVTYLTDGNDTYPVKLFGKHNLQNISGAMAVLKRLGITSDMFYLAIQSFRGADKRLELIGENNGMAIYKDYAHAPSKVRATTLAVKEQYPARDLVACLELHTFSSLNKEFIDQYKGTMKFSNVPIVYYSPATLEKKQLTPISKEDIKKSFGEQGLQVFDDKNELLEFLKKQNWNNKNLLLMTSGTFDGLDYASLPEVLK